MKKKIALVTGGSRGLGKNTAIKLALKDLDVIITYHSKKEEASQEKNRWQGRRFTIKYRRYTVFRLFL
jgi:NAD(P)-dependent dehydrogenase (short-subunit alcohol dehydrogenase family)